MADESMSQEGATTVPKLKFHPQYSAKKPGDVILRAGDNNLCFRFPLQTLALLSPSFFGDLPPPSHPSDISDGVPIITLHGTTSGGIHIFLEAVQSITSPHPLTASEASAHAIVDAAVVAKMFLVPIVGRLLAEMVRETKGYRSGFDFVEFAIWAIGGEVRSKIVEAAKATVRYDITFINYGVAEALKQHAPVDWMKLQDLHLRHAAAANHVRRRLRSYEEGEDIFSHETHSESDMDGRTQDEDLTGEILRKLWEAKTAEELMELEREDCGVACQRCMGPYWQAFGRHLDWVNGFAFDLDYKPVADSYW